MKQKIIYITIIVLITILSGVFVIKMNNTAKVSLVCEEKSEKCYYSIKSSKENLKIEFKHNEIMQCVVTPLILGDRDDSKKRNLYELSLMLHTRNDSFLLQHHQHKVLADICENVFKTKSFSINSRIKLKNNK